MNLTQFQFDRQDIRFVVINNEVYFVAKDIANVLEYQNTAQAIDIHIDQEDRITDIELRRRAKEFSLGQLVVVTRAIYTNESGVYGLIFGSTKPEAKVFKTWLTKEVLPSIRKTGTYSIESGNNILDFPILSSCMSSEDKIKKIKKNGEIYVFADNGNNAYKIGFTTNFHKREKQHKSSNPFLELICIYGNQTIEDEQRLHEKLKKYKIKGATEWYLKKDEVLEIIDVILLKR